MAALVPINRVRSNAIAIRAPHGAALRFATMDDMIAYYSQFPENAEQHLFIDAIFYIGNIKIGTAWLVHYLWRSAVEKSEMMASFHKYIIILRNAGNFITIKVQIAFGKTASDANVIARYTCNYEFINDKLSLTSCIQIL